MKKEVLNDKIYIKVKKIDRLQKNKRFIAVPNASSQVGSFMAVSCTAQGRLRCLAVYRLAFTVHRQKAKVDLIALVRRLFAVYIYKKFKTNEY